MNAAQAPAQSQERAQKTDLASAIFASVDGLAPDLRDTLHLHYYQGLTIEETAAALGFEDAAYFTRFFRRESGLSPLAFREFQHRR